MNPGLAPFLDLSRSWTSPVPGLLAFLELPRSQQSGEICPDLPEGAANTAKAAKLTGLCPATGAAEAARQGRSLGLQLQAVSRRCPG